MTRGVFEVAEICAQECSDDELLFWAASAGSFSNHPVSVSIRRAWNRRLEADKVSDFEELSGRGVRAKVEGITVAVGNKRLMAEEKQRFPKFPAAVRLFLWLAAAAVPDGYGLPTSLRRIPPQQ